MAIACAALLLLVAYQLIANRQGVGRDPRATSGGSAPSAKPGAPGVRSPLAGAGDAGAADGLPRAAGGA